MIIQFWDDPKAVPADVRTCMESWKRLEEEGFRFAIFDDSSAIAFIGSHYDSRHLEAFSKCAHPAMRADYFRLCYIALNGGVYIDADDSYAGGSLGDVLSSADLTLQPLCYDVQSDGMLDPFEQAAVEDDPDRQRIFYVNNNPLVASPEHPIVLSALERSTRLLLSTSDPRDIQLLTGPGNLTAALVEHAARFNNERRPLNFVLHPNWANIAKSQWPLEYRKDERNWRNWVQRPTVASDDSASEVAS